LGFSRRNTTTTTVQSRPRNRPGSSETDWHCISLCSRGVQVRPRDRVGSSAADWRSATICGGGAQGRPRDRLGGSATLSCASTCSKGAQGRPRNSPESSATLWQCARIWSRGVQGRPRDRLDGSATGSGCNPVPTLQIEREGAAVACRSRKGAPRPWSRGRMWCQPQLRSKVGQAFVHVGR